MQEVSNYVSSIVTWILTMTIIELILPNNKNKKYVMFSCSLVILLSVVNPILTVFGSEIDVSNEIEKFQKEMKTYENNSATNYSLEESLYDTYVENLKEDMQKRLEDMGYEILKTELQINESTYEPEKIEMQIRYQDGYVQPIVIDVFGNMANEKIYDADCIKIKEIISETYGVKKDKIVINGG